MDVLNLVVAIAFVGIFVLPTLWHLASDLRQRRGRSFSLIPHKKRHIVASVFRGGLIYGTGTLGSLVAEPTASMLMWCILSIVLFGLNAIGATDRRLTIHAETGLVKWRKISLPWWPSRPRNTGFVDYVRKVNLERSKQTKSLLGVGELMESWTSSYNGNMSTSGHYSERTLAWIAQEVNDYLDAFRRHDTRAARATRDRFREQFEAAAAPRRERVAARAQRTQLAKADKKRRKEARRVAKAVEKEQRRARRFDDKFRV